MTQQREAALLHASAASRQSPWRGRVQAPHHLRRQARSFKKARGNLFASLPIRESIQIPSPSSPPRCLHTRLIIPQAPHTTLTTETGEDHPDCDQFPVLPCPIDDCYETCPPWFVFGLLARARYCELTCLPGRIQHRVQCLQREPFSHGNTASQSDYFSQLAKYMKLDQRGNVLAEYVWIDGSNGLRNKTKVSRLDKDHLLRHCLVSDTLSAEPELHTIGLFWPQMHATPIDFIAQT